MTKRKPKNELQKRGPKSLFRTEYIRIAEVAAKFGATHDEIAKELGVSLFAFNSWRVKYPQLSTVLNIAKEVADARVEKSLYHRAVGYSHPAVKFLVVAGKVVEKHYTEYYPPDVTAGIYWTKNRMPDRWRDVQRVEAELGHYVISERPMTEEEWIRDHATPLIDVSPALSPVVKKGE